MSYLRLATRLYNAPLLIWPEKAAVIESVFRAHADGQALPQPSRAPTPVQHHATGPGAIKTDAGYYRTADGVALIPVVGTLVQRGDSMDAMSGLVSYNRIAGMLQAALEDPRVDAILLEIDSPGGEANGVMDLGAKVAAAAQKKPLWAHANEQAFSSAYWIASQASKLMVPKTGMVGSVGVYMMHVDQSQRDAKQGLVYTPIHAGARKVDFSSHAPLSDAARAVAQDDVNRLYDLFVETVATGRKISPKVVRDTEAGLLSPQKALSLGLIDGIAGFDEALASITGEARSRRTTVRPTAAAPAPNPTAWKPDFTVALAEHMERCRANPSHRAQAGLPPLKNTAPQSGVTVDVAKFCATPKRESAAELYARRLRETKVYGGRS